ncbi:hypothetical protein T484DRAFT_2926567 [Baffinella frigidus]|nr:hypothetical protein T484DRAFT_2926567 [Cryptophyta sp. CCMP2293]
MTWATGAPGCLARIATGCSARPCAPRARPTRSRASRSPTRSARARRSTAGSTLTCAAKEDARPRTNPSTCVARPPPGWSRGGGRVRRFRRLRVGRAGEVGTDGEAEAPGPLQAVATEIAVESRKYEGLLARVKDATETEDALLADMQASRTKLGNLMTRQRNMVGRLAGGEEEGEAPRAPETVRDAPAVQEVQAPGGEEAPRGEERAEEEVQPEARAVAEEPAGRETESPKHVEEPGGVEEPAGVEEREPVAAAQQGEPVAGFEGRFLFDPDMNADEIKDQDEYFTYGLQQKHLPVARTAVVDVIDYRTDQAFRAMGSEFPIDKFIGELTGLVLIKQGGEYTFASSSDDGSHIWIDGALVVSNEGLHPVETVRGTLDLTAGYHTVKVDFFEAEGGSAIWVEYSGPDTGGEDELLRAVHHVATLTAPTPPSGGGEPLDGFEARVIFDPEMDSGEIKDEGDYFRFAQETRHLPVSLTATVDTIDYHTDEAFRALGPGFDLDKFVVQWRGVFEVATEGYYTFASSSDDGSHIWIDGALVVSNEGLHPVETVKNTVKLNAGYHTVRVDFFENEGGAAISVKYSGPDTGGEEELLRGKHYPSAAPAPTATLPEVDGVVPLAGFVGRFFFDPQMNGDAIKDQDDYVKFAEEVRHLPVSVTDVTSVISYRHDVAFGFESRLDKFIGEWTGLVHISEAGAYTFASSSDDGSHIWIDGAMVVSNKGLHPVETVRGTVYLSPGYHTVKVDFFENQGGAAIWVNYWGPDTQGKEALLRGVHVPPPVPLDAALLPGFEAKFIFDPDMNGDEIKDQADYFASAKERGLTVSKTAVVDAINYGYDETFRSVAPDFPLDKFIAQWTGVVQIAEAGAYSFSSSSDDGSHIWIDGALVVSNEGLHGTQEVRGTVDLTAGYHTVKVDFFEAEGGSAIWVEYSGPDTGGEDRLLRALHYGAAGDPPSNTLLVESEDHGVCGAFAVHARTNITFAGVQSTIRSQPQPRNSKLEDRNPEPTSGHLDTDP